MEVAPWKMSLETVSHFVTNSNTGLVLFHCASEAKFLPPKSCDLTGDVTPVNKNARILRGRPASLPLSPGRTDFTDGPGSVHHSYFPFSRRLYPFGEFFLGSIVTKQPVYT